MIVECSNCDTRFQLDDARIPLRGIRVRCSRCKEAFFLEHPDASREDAVNDVAEQATRVSTPDATQDLQSRAPGTPASHSESDEDDWEFNGSLPGGDSNGESRSGRVAAPVPAPAPPQEAAGSEIDDDLGVDEDEIQVPGLGVDDMSVDDDDDDFVSGLDLAEGGAASPEAQAAAESVDLGADADVESESDFGDMSDFSSHGDGPAPAPTAPAAAPAATQAAQKTAQTAPRTAPAQEIGEPEDWDFFSDDSQEDSSLGSMDNAMGRVMEAVEDPSRMRAPARDPDLGSVGQEHGARLAGLRSIGRGLGWLATCGLLGLGIARGVIDASTTTPQPMTGVDFGDFEAQQVRGAWLETARSTDVYAVSGDLVNDSTEARMPGTSLRVSLVSPDGSEIDHPAARAGLLIAEADLRELPAEDLAWAYQRAVSDLAVMRLEPGQAVRFQALFEGVPDEATGFVLEMEARSPPLPPLSVEPDEPVEELYQGDDPDADMDPVPSF